jgi:hypothetical protein
VAGGKAVSDTKRRIEITVERRRILLVRRRNPSAPISCEVCTGNPQMLPLDEAARLLGMSERAIFRRVEARQVHFIETPDGRLYVCGSSLLG